MPLKLSDNMRSVGDCGWRALVVAIGLVAGLIAALSTPSFAQEDGGALWGRGGCLNCHGNLAAGDGDAAYPAGPNLRRTKLERDQLIETIACGRPGADMPYNLAGAYTEIACYDLPLGEAPEEVANGPGFTAGEIEALVDFLVANVVGVTKITRENCGAFFGGNPNVPSCLQY